MRKYIYVLSCSHIAQQDENKDVDLGQLLEKFKATLDHARGSTGQGPEEYTAVHGDQVSDPVVLTCWHLTSSVY